MSGFESRGMLFEGGLEVRGGALEEDWKDGKWWQSSVEDGK